MFSRSIFLSFMAGLAAVTFTALPVQAQEAGEISDPFESYNRVMFKFNTALDDYILAPIAKGYRYAVPKPVRTGVHNVLTQLNTPITLGNQLLQGDANGFARTATRFTINTFVGLGGIIDVAGSHGLKDQPEDFGQTLAVWGVGNGPYIVPPLFQPGSLRDQVGYLVDGYADPVRLYLSNTDQEEWYYARFAIATIDDRENLLDALADLRKNSIDYYAAIRSVTTQRRAALIADNDVEDNGTDIPDYDTAGNN